MSIYIDRHLLRRREPIKFSKKVWNIIKKDIGEDFKIMTFIIMAESGYDLKKKIPKKKIKGYTRCPVCRCHMDYFILPNTKIHFYCTTEGCYMKK